MDVIIAEMKDYFRLKNSLYNIQARTKTNSLPDMISQVVKPVDYPGLTCLLIPAKKTLPDITA